MKDSRKFSATWRRLGLLTIVAWLGGLALPARASLFLNETFEGPQLDIGGWENNVVVLERDYVAGVGVGGSRAMQMSGEFYSVDYAAWFAMMYLNPIIADNAGATRANTMMALDVKTDVVGGYLGVGLQSWPGNWYDGTMGFSLGSIPIWAGTPGEFQTITVSLADPLWTLPPWDPSQTDPFHPDGGTIQVYFQAESWNFGGPGTAVTATVDDLRFWTVINDLAVTPAVLWPPNHKMVKVAVDYTLCDGDGLAPIVATELSVTSNEPANGLGDGNTSADWEVIDSHHVRLRAERSGTGDGRVYTITVTATDALGNVSSHSAFVTVPKS